jgi:hypothetical protein
LTRFRLRGVRSVVRRRLRFRRVMMICCGVSLARIVMRRRGHVLSLLREWSVVARFNLLR